MEGNKALQPHEQRVVEERNDLIEKVTKLHAFFKTEMFNSLKKKDQDLLDEQSRVMMNYADILLKRIERF